MQRIPIDLILEYRGRSEAREYADRKTGEIRTAPAVLKFEHESSADGDGDDVTAMEVTGSQLDRCSPPFDYASLRRGDRVHVTGAVVLAPRGSDKDSFFVVEHASRAHAEVAPLAKAS